MIEVCIEIVKNVLNIDHKYNKIKIYFCFMIDDSKCLFIFLLVILLQGYRKK